EVERWSSETSGTTVSIAYSTGLKQRTWPPPQASARAGTGARATGAGAPAPGGGPRVLYTRPAAVVARIIAWVVGASREKMTRVSRMASSHRTRRGRGPEPTVLLYAASSSRRSGAPRPAMTRRAGRRAGVRDAPAPAA